MNEQVSNRQIFFLVYFTIVGYTIVELPQIMAVSAGSGAWLVLTAVTAICLLPVWMITCLNRKFPGKTLFEYSQLLLGKFLSYVLLVLFLLYTLGVFSFINRVSGEVIRIDFIRGIPIWQISVLMIAVVCYALSKGLTNLLRVFELFGIVILFILSFIFTVMFTQGHLLNMQPFFQLSHLEDYLKGITNTVMPYLGFELMLVIPFTNKNNKNICRYTLLSVILVGITYIIMVESVFSLVGVDDAKNYTDCLIVAIRRLDIRSLQFLQRFDSMFVIAWFISAFFTSSMYAYGAFYALRKLFPRLKAYIHLVILGILAFIIGSIPGSHKNASDALTKVDIYLGLFIAVVLPGILLIWAKVKKVGSEGN